MKQGFTDVGENNDLLVKTLNWELRDMVLIPNFPQTLYVTSMSHFTPSRFYTHVEMGSSVLSLGNSHESACLKWLDTGLPL